MMKRMGLEDHCRAIFAAGIFSRFGARIVSDSRQALRIRGATTGPFKTVWTNIKLDQTFEPSLFSVKPPAGFSVKPLAGIDLNASPADYMAQLLKIYAKCYEGKFPAKFPDDLRSLGQKL